MIKKVSPVKSANVSTPSVPFPIVGIGASAGGLEAFTLLLKHFPPATGMALVLVQHLDPHHDSVLTSLLARTTTIPISEVTNDLRVEPNHVYVIPPNTNMSIVHGVLKLQARYTERIPNHSIDFFLESLALDRGGRAIGVILSGSATDGTLGLEAIKGEGGITFAQDDSAKYDSMPRNAVGAGCVDFVLSPEKISAELARIAKHPYVLNAYGQSVSELHSEDDQEDIEHESDDEAASEGHGPLTRADESPFPVIAAVGLKKIIQDLSRHSGVDFTLYKTGTLQRRIARRVVLNKLETLDDYARFLHGNEKELDMLYADVLINVTSFFRNPEVFETLKDKVFPKIYQNQKHRDSPIRVWVMGCSTGQEAYSIAMSFLEFSENSGPRQNMQVFATDLNEAALDKARRGLYAKTLALDLSPARLKRFFIEEDGGYRIIKTLREMCVFARQNMIGDPPFSRMDLISCRNVMIYLSNSAQQKIMSIIHYALKPMGVLLLGTSESAGQSSNLFESLDKKQRIYIRKSGPTPTWDQRYTVKQPENDRAPAASRVPAPAAIFPSELNALREADRIALDQFAPPGVVVDADLQILQFRGDTRDFLLPPRGKATLNVLKMAREGLMLPLRNALSEAKKTNKTIRKTSRLVEAGCMVNLEVIPLKNIKDLSYLVFFEKAALAKATGQKSAKNTDRPGLKTRKGRREDAGALLELQRELNEARDYTQSVEEQFAAAYEELQASSEELQSANEELQSVNEELETSKEELESNNEELTTVNEEMAHRNIDLITLNSDLNNFHLSVDMAFVLLARDLTIRRFTSQATRTFNLIPTDLGRPIGNMKHNLDCPELEQILSDVINTVSVRTCDVQNKEGCWFSLRVRPYMTLDNRIDGAVLVLVDIDALKKTEESQRISEIRYRRLFEAAKDGIIILDPVTSKITEINPFLLDFLGYAKNELVGKELYEIGLLKDEKENQDMFEKLKKDGIIRYENLPLLTKGGTRREVEFVSNLYRENGHDVVQCNIRDITERKRAQDTVNFLSEASGVLLASLDYKKTLAALTALIVPRLADWAFIDLMKGNEMVRLAVAHADPNQAELAEQVKKFPLLKSTGGHVGELDIFAGKSVLYSELTEALIVSKLTQSREHASVVRAVNPKSVMLVPLIARNSVIGILVMIACGPRRFDAKDLALAEELGWRAATAIDNARLFNDSEEVAAKLAEVDRAKDEFMAMLGHELRNPLAPIKNAAEVQRIRKCDDPVIQKTQAIIERQAAHMVTLLDDLLDTSRIQQRKVSLRKENLELNSLLLHVLDSSKTVMDAKNQTLELEIKTDPPIFVSADPARLEQIFSNLITNAIKYTPKNGVIRISSKREEKMAVVRILDNGIGIEKHMLTEIFGLFKQVNNSLERQGGLGLGLKLVQDLVQMHGGTVEARSEGLGRGSEFVVRLPVLSGTGLQHKSMQEESASRPNKHVLVIDDNPDILESMHLLLTLTGHSVEMADDGETGVNMALSGKFDIALIDIGLPNLSGYDVAKKIRAHPNGANIYLVALTGYGQTKDRARALEAGFDEHLVKPVDSEVLWKIFSRATRTKE